MNQITLNGEPLVTVEPSKNTVNVEHDDTEGWRKMALYDVVLCINGGEYHARMSHDEAQRLLADSMAGKEPPQ